MHTNWHDSVLFGLHFDLHANETDQVGAALSVDHLVEQLEKVRPDYVHCDCKGHAGYASYPTRVGVPAPSIVRDSLRIWRDATRRLGLPLVVHYSGIWDRMALARHPEWGRDNGGRVQESSWLPQVQGPGGLDANMACPLSPYTESYMAAQMAEILEDYDVDGFWVDGENWATAPCYCPLCREAFRQRTGRTDAPRSPAEDGWEEWLASARANFDTHVRHYAEGVHRRKPGSTVCSNWMYTLRQPEPVTVPVDYLSGDFSWIWGPRSALVEARFLDGRGLPWDLMAWGFTSHGPMRDWTFKTVPALCQEAAVVLSCGGAFMVYDQPNRSGDLVPWHMDRLADVAAFCRARQPWVQGTRSVPQVAILHSHHHVYAASQPLYNPGKATRAVEGALHLLLELGLHADLLQDETLLARLDEYPLVVVPEQTRLPEATAEALAGYAGRGGRLLVSGADGTRPFDRWLGLGDAAAGLPGTPLYLPDLPGTEAAIGTWRPAVPTPGDPPIRLEPLLASRNPEAADADTPFAAAIVRRHGDGRLAGVPGALFEGFAESHYPGLRRFAGRVLEALDVQGLARISAPPTVHAALRERDGTLLLHLVNLASTRAHAPQDAYVEDVPAVGPVDVDLPVPFVPGAVCLEPGRRPVAFRIGEGRLRCRVEACGIHDILVIAPAG